MWIATVVVMCIFHYGYCNTGEILFFILSTILSLIRIFHSVFSAPLEIDTVLGECPDN